MLCLTRFLILAITILTMPYAVAKDMPIVDPSDVFAKYGKPDRIISTEYDKPRPPFVTRMSEYRKENVRIALLANAPIGSPPPYKSWRLIGFQDLKSNEVIAEAEANQRLGARKKK